MEVSIEDESKARGKWEGPADYKAKSDALLSYSYTESLYDVKSPFSLTIAPKADKNRLTWLDKIAPMDLVFIEEFGKVRYCGLVHQVRYSARMGQDGPSRSIVVSGNGFGGLLESFQLLMNMQFWMGKIPESANAKIEEKILAADSSYGEVMKLFYDDFMEIIATKLEGLTQSAIQGLLRKYLDMANLAPSFKTGIPLAVGLYQPGINNIWDMWRRIMPVPYGELFGRWDNSAYKVFARQAPFDADDWSKLDCVAIHPLALTGYDVGVDDSEIYSAFVATAPSLGFTETTAFVVDSADDARRPVIVSEPKWMRYGYRPLVISVKYLNRDAADTKTGDVATALHAAAEKAANWYKNNDTMLSGSISLISIDDKNYMTYPVVGNKVSFLGGEFYVEQVERKWAYGDSPRTSLKVTRGYMYDQSGNATGPIRELGKKITGIEVTNA